MHNLGSVAAAIAALCLVQTAAADPDPGPAAAAPQAEPMALPAPTSPAAEPAASKPAGELPTAPTDLRAGHWLVGVSGGVWSASAKLVGLPLELGGLSAGGAAHALLGVGLSRFLVLQLDGGVAHAGANHDGCDACTATSIDVGASLTAHLTQGFAFDPWVGYGLGYRHTLLSDALASMIASAGEPPTAAALDFARLSLGGDFYPIPWLGFGPYLEIDVGVRPADGSSVYALVHTGLRLAFDPLQAGTRVGPATASR